MSTGIFCSFYFRKFFFFKVFSSWKLNLFPISQGISKRYFCPEGKASVSSCRTFLLLTLALLDFHQLLPFLRVNTLLRQPCYGEHLSIRDLLPSFFFIYISGPLRLFILMNLFHHLSRYSGNWVNDFTGASEVKHQSGCACAYVFKIEVNILFKKRIYYLNMLVCYAYVDWTG